MIKFHLESRSGVAPYLQLVHQVKHALRLGFLRPGDQLPTVREVVTEIAINPNTVFKAYRELEREGLVQSFPGRGTFVRKTLMSATPAEQEALLIELTRWLHRASDVGLDRESILALFTNALQEMLGEKASR